MGEAIAGARAVAELVLTASASLGEVTAHIQQSNTEQQRSTQQVATAGQQMAAAAAALGEDTLGVAAEAKASEQAAEQGRSQASEAMTEMEQLAGQVAEAAHAMERLRKENGQINGIAELIHKIADQTNLLALNASIEAARAGEAGRSFAVVADEVRKLAQSTVSSVSSINSIVERTNKETEDASHLIAECSRRAEQSREKTRKADDSFADIVRRVKAITSSMNQISAGLNEQQGTNGHIVANLKTIEQSATDNVEVAKKLSWACENLQSISERLATQVEQFLVTPTSESSAKESPTLRRAAGAGRT